MSNMSHPENININDFSDDDVISINGTLFKIEVLKKLLESSLPKISEALHQNFQSQGENIDLGATAYQLSHSSWKNTQNQPSIWVGGGLASEVLQKGCSRWKKGKVKLNVVIEFIPDEPDNPESHQISDFQHASSPLDELRNININAI